MRVGIILTTYGEPQRNSFAEQWLYSYRILKGLTRKIAPIPAPLLPIIATARATGRVRLWGEHDFASQLEPLHLVTVDALQQELSRAASARAAEFMVTHAYEFRRPMLAEALQELASRGCERAVVVPMYIADGDFTHGMTRFALEDALRRQPIQSIWREPERVSMCSLTAQPDDEAALAETVARYCLSSMAARGLKMPDSNWAVLLAAHGTVVTSPPQVDNGLAHFGRILIQVKRLLRPHVGLVRIGWLNHTRGGQWTTPTVNDALQFVRDRGFERLVYFPWGFTTDNAETALEGRIALAELDPPMEHIEYLEAINAHAPFVQLMANRIIGHLLDQTSPGAARSESTPAQPMARSA